MNAIIRGSFGAATHLARTHKWITASVIVLIAGGAWWWYGKATSTSGQTLYVLGSVSRGTIISTVSGSGEVSPSNQVTINPKASGQITRVLVSDGAYVGAGQALAYIDATNQQNAVRNAQADIESARLSLQKLQKPADTLSVTQSQNAIAKAQESEQSAQTDLAKAYADSYNDVVSTFLDFPDIMTGLKDIEIGTEAAHGSQWNIDYYRNATENWDEHALTYRDTAYNTYTKTLGDYNTALADYQKTNQSSSTSTIEAISNETYATTQSLANALNSMNSFVQFYENLIKLHDQSPVSEADTSLTNLSTYIGKVNAHLSTLLSDINQIKSDKQAIADAQRTIIEDQQSLDKLNAGADPLDVQSSQLSIQQKQNALQSAQDTLADYTIRAPFAGTLNGFNLHIGDTVGSGTNVATLFTRQQIAQLSLNEVDAAKIVVGQKATLTFDAIPDLSLTGTVVQVSGLGTVSQGVVSYTIKIALDAQDPRIKAGMTINADIQTAVHQNVLEVSASAIKTSNGSSYVQAFTPPLTNATSTTSGVASKIAPQNIPVVVGISDGATTEITSGLTEGTQIVTRTTTSGTSKTTAASATSRTGGGPGGGGGAVFRGL